MNRFLSLLVIALIVAACQPKKQDEQSSADSVDAEVPAVTTAAAQLTDEQKANGWRLLFDGQTTNGWEFFKDLPNDSWEVSDGTLHCKAFVDGVENKRSDIMTTEEFENFELAFDWKITPQGNSGVMFRVTEENPQPYHSGPEYQVLDDEGYPGDPKANQLSGGSYDMYEVPTAKPNALGEWNQSKLVVNGNHVEHWLNGTKVLEYEIGSDDWKKRKAASKWKDVPTYSMSKKGHIDIQDHNHEVWYKNIMIKTL